MSPNPTDDGIDGTDDADGINDADATDDANTALVAGAAALNVGEYDIARAVWSGETPLATDAEVPLRLGLAAFARAVLDARHGEWAAASAAVDDADSALANLEAEGVDLAPIRRWLAAFRADPEIAERSPPPTLTVAGERPTPGELPLPAAALVAAAVATGVGDDPAVIVDAHRFAADAARPETTRYATFVRDYASTDASQRPVVFQRLEAIVEEQRRKEEDVSGLFD